MESFKKASGSADMSGELYEVYVLMLLFLRCTLKADSFRLATNVYGAGAFDDIILWHKDITYFFQLKHKANKPVTRHALCSVKGDFSLIKYFCSYLEVKKNFSHNKNEFIIYTNAKMENPDGQIIEAKDLVSSGGKIFTFTDQSEEYKVFQMLKCYKSTLQEISEGKHSQEEIKLKLKQLKNLPLCRTLLSFSNDEIRFMEEIKKQNKQCQEWDWDSCSELWDEFMMNLKLYIEQSNLENLEVLLKEELLNLCGTLEVFVYLKEGIISWWRKKESEYCLTNKTNEFWKNIMAKHVSDLTSTMHSKMEPVSGLKFQHIQDMPQATRITQIISQDSTELSCLRVHQRLNDNEHLIIHLNVLKQHLREVLFVWKHYQTLVVDTSIDKDTGGSTDTEVITQVSNILHSDPDKKIIFICKKSHNIFMTLSRTFNSEIYMENFNLCQMTYESQETLMNCKVDFQGRSVELKRLACDPSFVTADIILTLMKEGKLQVGGNLPVESAMYIDRALLRREIVNTEFLRVTQNDCIAFSGISLSELKKLLPCDGSVQHLSKDDKIDTKSRYFTIDGNSSFTKLCQSYEKVHWIEKQGESFVWRCSHGDITLINNILNKNAPPVRYSNILEVLNVSSQLVILIAEPGMGKSTEMTHLARVIKQENSATWVVIVNLSDHTNILARQDFTALELLCRAGHFETKLERSLFEHEIHHGGNIIVLIDGVDEISPNYYEKVIQIVKGITSKKIKKICLTSRSNMRSKLEFEFNSLAFCLDSFSKNDQIRFMNKFWNMENSEEGISFANKVLDLTSKCLKDKGFELFGIPLQTSILAEVFESAVKEYVTSGKVTLPENLDILQLYEQFIDCKCQLYFEKDKSDKTKLYVLEKNEMVREIMQQRHELCALVAFLSEQQFASLFNSRNLKKKYHTLINSIKDGSEKTGLITEIVNDKPKFLHRTFLEFFTAHWLSQNYKSNQTLILNNLFDVEWEIVRTFLDRILCADFELHRAVLNQDLTKVQSLLTLPDVSVNETDEGGRTALHLAVMSLNDEEYEKGKKILAMVLENEADLNIEDELCGWTALRFAETMKSWFAVDVLLEKGADMNDLELIKENIHNHEYISNLLDLSIKKGFKHIIDFLLKCGIDVNYIFSYMEDIFYYRYRMLHVAAMKGQLQLVQLLVEHGADLELRDLYEEKTPVMWASETGKLEVVKFLKGQGSQLQLSDRHGNTPLILASESGNIDLVQYLVQSGQDIDIKNRSNKTAMMRAAEKGNWEIVKFLYSSGADITASDYHGNSLMHCAAEKGDVDFITQLLILGINVNIRNKKDQTPAHRAAYYERWEVVRILLESGADSMACDSDGDTLLHYVAMRGAMDIINELLDQGIDVNVRNKKMQTPIHKAAYHEKWEVVKFLLERGSDHMACDSDGDMLFHYVVTHNDMDIINHLLELGVNVNVRNKRMQTPVHKAAYSEKWGVVKLLLESGADHMVCDSDGDTLLHYVAMRSAEDIIIFLLELEININVRNKRMQTPAHRAAYHQQWGVVKLLLESGADYMARDSDGNTLLHYVAMRDDNNIITQLLDLGINVNVKNNNLQTPIHSAAFCKRWKVVELLLERGADHIACDNDGNTLLHYVAMHGAKDTLIQLLGLGVNVNVRNKRMQTPAHRAAYYERWEVVKLLLECGADHTACDRDGDTLLHSAAGHNARDIIIQLLNLGVCVNFRNEKQQTPVHKAAYYEGWEVVKFLLECGADHMACDSDGNTLLHYVAIRGAKDIINQLLDLGINVNVVNNRMQTPAHRAAYNERWEALQLLLDCGADHMACDTDGNTLLHYVAMRGAKNIIIQLLDLGINVNVRNKRMQTPIHSAAFCKRWKVVEILLEQGADHMACDNDGNTLLHYVAMHGAKDIIILLLNLGVCVNVKNKKMQTPAHIAADNGKLEFVKLLLDHGTNLTVNNNNSNP